MKEQQFYLVAQIIGRLSDEPMAEGQFLALCRALGAVDSEALEWGLETLSMSGLLA